MIGINKENITVVVVAAKRLILVAVREFTPIDSLVNSENGVDEWR